MGRNFISLNFTSGSDNDGNALGYISDRGAELSIRGRFILPPDIDLAQAAAIATAVGGTINTESSVCSDSSSGSPRRLYFYRENGGSMSVPVRQRDDVISAATAIKGILDAGTAGGSVVCIKEYLVRRVNGLNNNQNKIIDFTDIDYPVKSRVSLYRFSCQ